MHLILDNPKILLVKISNHKILVHEIWERVKLIFTSNILEHFFYTCRTWGRNNSMEEQASESVSKRQKTIELRIDGKNIEPLFLNTNEI